MTPAVTRTLQVPRDIHTVWRALTTDIGLAQWFWSQWPDTDYELRAERGGQYHFHSDSARTGVFGVFSTFREPTLLEMTWDWDAPDGNVTPSGETVRFELAEDGAQTRLTLTHTLSDESHRQPYEQAWDDILPRLAKI